MNLDLLISKYIDGELTAQEDVQLRNLLKEDPLAREEFDDFLELHLAMVEDADTIIVPNAVKRATEDRVMMAILNDMPKIIPLQKRSYGFYYKAASVAIFLMFAFIFQINDKFYQFTDVSDNAKSDNSKEILSQESNLGNQSQKIKKLRKNIIAKTNEGNNSNIPIVNDETLQNVDIVSNNIIENKSDIVNIESNESINYDNKPIINDNNSKINKSTNIEITNNKLDLVNPNNLGQFDPFNNYSQSEINLSTSISYDFLRSGINTFENTAIKNYSQSISYSIDKDSRIGMEFGLTEFYYPNTHFVKINKSIVEVLDPTSGDNIILVPITVKETEKNYWGTVFYEQNILNYNEFALDGRLGLGSNSDGFLGIGRLIAKYNIFSGLYLSAGAEGRMFSYKLPLKNTNGFANNLSFVWGIYFQF